MPSSTQMPTKETAVPDRSEPVATDEFHYVTGMPLAGPFPDGSEMAMFGMGCFWGPEPLFWELPGVWVTAVGYSGGSRGFTVNPTYDDVKTGLTGHAEVVRVVFDPKRIAYEHLLRLFWEKHDPTTGMQQGRDKGTQYRSVIYYYDDRQRALAEQTRADFQKELSQSGFGTITTEIEAATTFYFAEAYHQAYVEKDPTRYCGMSGTGVSCRIRPKVS